MRLLWLLSTFCLVANYLVCATPINNHQEVVFQASDTSNVLNNHGADMDDIFGIPTDKKVMYKLDDIQYFTPYYYPSHTLDIVPALDLSDHEFRPVTVISIPKQNEDTFTDEQLRLLIESYFQEDDVLNKEFFRNIILLPEDDIVEYKLGISTMVNLLREYNIRSIILDERFLAKLPSPGAGLPSIPIYSIRSSSLAKGTAGPFLMKYRKNQHKIDLYPVYRLYSDYYKTFVNGIYPLNDGLGTYRTLNELDPMGNLLIPIPSKLYAKGSNKPLRGERTAIKDIFDINGVPTTAGSRLYAAFRGDVHQTASSVQKLEDEGAVIVGKVKTTAFANSGFTIEETPDHLYPFSPRGDQYQTCGTSSSGSACSLAAYDWLDFTVGTDTGGSIRRPAAIVGLYGNRPSQGIVSLDGVLPNLAWSDTAGVFTRSPTKLKKVLQTWYADSQANRRFNHLPSTMLVPSDDLPTMPRNIRDIVMNFLQEVEHTLGMKTEMINQTATHPHKHTENETYHGEFMTRTDFLHTMDAWQWKEVNQGLMKAYGHANEGRFPPVGTSLQRRWQQVRDDAWSDEDFDAMRKKLEVTAEWLNGIIGRDEETCSKTIYMEPTSLERLPLYRESRLNNITEHLVPERKNPLYPFVPASISGAPHYIIPIGQVPFKSLVSGRVEMQTVSMSFMAYPGCDFMLLDFIDNLGKAGVIKEVKTGRTAF